MKGYKAYFDRQELSPQAHAGLLALERAKAHRKPRGSIFRRYGALAACCALIISLGIYGAGRLIPEPDGPVTPPDGAEDNILPGPEGNSGFTVGGDNNEHEMLFMIPAISYPLIEQENMTSPDFRHLPNNGCSFSVELNREDIVALLWGGYERMEEARGENEDIDLPWPLMWEGFTIFGKALYDNEGHLEQVNLWGESDSEQFDIQLAPGALPLTCIAIEGEETSTFNGVDIKGRSYHYDFDGSGVEDHRYESTFIAHDVGVRAQFTVKGEAAASDEAALDQCTLRSNLFIRWACIDPGLSLTHIEVCEDIPEWREEEFDSLDKALEETAFAPYLPAKAPVSGEFHGDLNYHEGARNILSVTWTRNYDNVTVSVSLPESNSDAPTPVDINVPESYDTRLYEIPWCDSVPEEYQLDFYSVTFRAQDMSLEAVEARQTGHDTGGVSFHFKVLHENGVLVSYSCDGMTAREVWQLVEPTLDN